MDLEALRQYLLGKHGAREGLPFGPDVLVLKVAGKIFALFPFDAIPPRVNLKCDPALALELRERYQAVQPGYHMNKKHWNTVILDGSLRDAEVRRMIDHSYELVVQGLSRSAKKLLEKESRSS